jgi:predicted GH43/DUF377 family glycosyl hydrolase
MSKQLRSLRRLPERLHCDPTRTIIRFFWPGSNGRAHKIIDRVMGLDDARAGALLDEVRQDFASDHPGMEEIFEEHFKEVTSRIGQCLTLMTRVKQLLIGAYFSMEYAHEAAALFNPSMVPFRDQSESAPGEVRFLMSLRAVGEGHLSSIVFRFGVVNEHGEVHVEEPPHHSKQMRATPDAGHNKERFYLKVIEGGVYRPFVDSVMEMLSDPFTTTELDEVLTKLVHDWESEDSRTAASVVAIRDLARANYEVHFDLSQSLGEFVLFPISEMESQGMEDMRLTQFVDDDGSEHYYGTYTAFDGKQIFPQLLDASGAGVVRVHTMSGRYACNKGMALFPRKIDGNYAMIGRMDGENLYYLTSDNVRFWNDATLIQEPVEPWEFMLIGNCGPPIETPAGWLLLTHGVGPMRRYCMGASLLDLGDPTKVIGRLREPLLAPEIDEREGYVPNVVYSCGAMVHNGHLVIPYGMSDVATGFAVLDLDELLEHLLS